MSRNSKSKWHPGRNMQFSEDKCVASGDHPNTSPASTAHPSNPAPYQSICRETRPRSLTSTALDMNWRGISHRRTPVAVRILISRVRSYTAISITASRSSPMRVDAPHQRRLTMQPVSALLALNRGKFCDSLCATLPPFSSLLISPMQHRLRIFRQRIQSTVQTAL